MPLLSQQIRLFRAERGLSLRDLAALAHVSPAAVSRWENGLREPGASQLSAVAKALSVSVADLLDERPSPSFSALPELRDRDGLYHTDPATKLIPVVGWAHAGEPRAAYDWADSYMPVRASDWSRTKWGTRIEGDCMEPDLREGDFVGIAECLPDDLRPSIDIILARWDGRIVCRLWGGYIDTRPRMLSLIPRNTNAYPVLTVPFRDVHIIGRIAWSHREW